jgi:hypothetical protein
MNDKTKLESLFNSIELDNEAKSGLPIYHIKWEIHKPEISETIGWFKVDFYNSNNNLPMTFFKNYSKIFR